MAHLHTHQQVFFLFLILFFRILFELSTIMFVFTVITTPQAPPSMDSSMVNVPLPTQDPAVCAVVRGQLTAKGWSVSGWTALPGLPCYFRLSAQVRGGDADWNILTSNRILKFLFRLCLSGGGVFGSMCCRCIWSRAISRLWESWSCKLSETDDSTV